MLHGSLISFLVPVIQWRKKIRLVEFFSSKNVSSFQNQNQNRLKGSVLSIMPNRPVRDQWEYLRKTERHFPIKLGQPIFFPNSLIRAKNRVVKNGTAYFSWNMATEISWPPPEVIPNTPVRRNRNGPFHLNSDRNFRNLWHSGKHPSFHWSVQVLIAWFQTVKD